MLQLVSTYREFCEFMAAKRRRREPFRLRGKGGATAEYVPRHLTGFHNFRATLRGVGDWGQASERLDALEHALTARHAIGLPLPRKVTQNEDRSLTVFWEGLSVRCFRDGLASLLGGTAGVAARGITREILDALNFQARIQGMR